MKQKLFFLTLSFLLISSLSTLNAQEALPTSGGDASGSGGSASYSIGQMAYTTNTGSNGSVAQGVQQAFEISTVLGIEDNQLGISFITFPNPTSDKLTLKISDPNNIDLVYQLYDTYGRLLRKEKIKNQNTIIPTQYLAPATYFLKVVNENNSIRIFKIIKTQ